MSEHRSEQRDGPEPADRARPWTRPQVDRLHAGGAEGAQDVSTDGIDIPS